MIEWISSNSALVHIIATLLLVLITAYYAYITRRILIATNEQSKLRLDPVIGIEIETINISKLYGPNRREMSVNMKIINVGNSPAIEILIDAEVELRYSSISDINIIPARLGPNFVPYLCPNEITDRFHSPSFGNKLICHFFDDVREARRLNIHRIETKPTEQSFSTSRLYIYAYYRNSLGQIFKSTYEIEIGLNKAEMYNPIPSDDEQVDVEMYYVPKPKFNTVPIESRVMDKELNSREANRNLCGW
ncbi:MAG: hypothetical protein KAR42_09510 [candidate division Zixibacteria bacterium]|nr:hypothetical protein [candidate division Zixibacteria bacterium]